MRKNYRIIESNLTAALKTKATRTIQCDCGLGCGFAGGPKILIHALDEDDVNAESLNQQITRVFQDADWEIVTSKPNYELTPRVRYSGFKTALELGYAGLTGPTDSGLRVTVAPGLVARLPIHRSLNAFGAVEAGWSLVSLQGGREARIDISIALAQNEPNVLEAPWPDR